MIVKFGKETIQEKDIKSIEKKLHSLEKEVNFLMEKYYVQNHIPLYGAWGIRGLDWYTGKNT
jgi:hypothetical protein